ncbi:hypothetical protein [Vallicoccus soli]|uniref:Uncharacterized protein n=1 Tax=Vallicoccus soli TaxID=2339232 RepID=A0A3A3YPG2_9ACTN|nr:hypothetical protein [Vallicoccus soli]RJK92461.1 hypothetical protein D5H78_18980 [Vallicoccus soli]
MRLPLPARLALALAVPAALLAGGAVQGLAATGAGGGAPAAVGNPLQHRWAGPADPASGRVPDAASYRDPALCGDALVLAAPAPGERAVCVHLDVAPPGVDVREPVSTRELQARVGAGPRAVAAANALGVPTATQVGAGSTVTCDGDGAAGYRVQAVYAVEAGRTNRYAALLPSMRTWAAGVDDVVSRSAALTGGTRAFRWVHAPASSGCEASVLNVTVPAGSTASFGGLMTALRAQGLDDPTRKYLVWTDASVLCGVATMYDDERAGQDNPNNGYAAQYARVDTACWGQDGGHSVEAHELVHTIGGVQDGAPNSTLAGHCNDEADTMCYPDGGSRSVMRQVCEPASEYLLDCRSDDYFSTAPVAGSYLDTHWNAADSRWLLGGGDGSGGGSEGVPTRLGARLTVNGPAVPGLPTQAGVALQLPEGRTATVTWGVADAGCRLGSATGEQTTVTCPAATTATTSVTAVVRDSAGSTVTVAAPLAFAASPRRQVDVVPLVGGSSTAYEGCTGAAVPVGGRVVDRATGAPVLGLTVEALRATTGAPVLAASVLTGTEGTATRDLALSGTSTWTARTRAAGPYDAATGAGRVAVTTGTCTAALTLEADRATAWYGAPLVLSGRLTRTVDGAETGVGGQSVGIWAQSGSAAAKLLVSGRTAADGTYRIATRATVTGTLTARLAGSAGYRPASSEPVPVTAQLPTSVLTASADRLSVRYRQPVALRGTLTRDAAGTTAPLAGATVLVQVTKAGTTTPLTVATGRTAADGSYAVTALPTYGGALQVRYAGTAATPAATQALGTLAVADYGTVLAAAADTTSVRHRQPVVVSGTLQRDDGGTLGPLAGATVAVQVVRTGTTSPLTLGSARVAADGSWSATVAPTAGGALRASYAGAGGQPAAVRPLGELQVAPYGSALTAAAGRSAAAYGQPVPVSGTLLRTDGAVAAPLGGATVLVQVLRPGTTVPVTLATARTASTGSFAVQVPARYSGALQAHYAGTAGQLGDTQPLGQLTVS